MLKTHGMANTRIYRIWSKMKERCGDENHQKYKHYGGRGIKVIWESFEEFRDDMYESYLEHVKLHGEKDTTIDRIDVNGNYSKQNCRWATMKEQMRNMRSNRLITFKGETKCLVDWATEYGMSIKILHWRLKRWSVEKSIETPVRKMVYKVNQ